MHGKRHFPVGKVSCVARVLAVWCCVLALRTGWAQKLDLNTNGISDVWEIINGASQLAAGGDADGDGVSNLRESIAGTNPFDSNSVPRIGTVGRTGNVFIVNVPCALGKRYELQSILVSAGGSWTNWVSETNIIARTPGIVTLTAPIPGWHFRRRHRRRRPERLGGISTGT
jgi:hypothetical protein